MTDEERAIEYVRTNHTHIMSNTMKSIYKKIYLDGLAEGRKESGEDINVLAKENEELKKDKEWLDNTNNEQTRVILKLNEQIEKMKCCKKERLCRRERITYGLGRCEEWEIKEA